MQAKKQFHFSCFWPHFPGFQEVVAQASLCPLGNVSSFARLDWVLRNTARFLRSRIDHSIGNIHMQLDIAKEVVLHLEVVRDHRQLHAHEEYLRQQAKLKSLAVSSLQCTIARQESHIQWLSKGDAPTQFFHIHANAHYCRNCIRTLQHEGQTLVTEQAKAEALFNFYDKVLGEPSPRSCSINLDLLNIL
jgi:hypothetical protein